MSEGTNFSKTDISLRTGLSHLDFPREKKSVSLLYCFGGQAACGHASGGMAPETSTGTRTCPMRVVPKTERLRGCTKATPPSSLSAQVEGARHPLGEDSPWKGGPKVEPDLPRNHVLPRPPCSPNQTELFFFNIAFFLIQIGLKWTCRDMMEKAQGRYGIKENVGVAPGVSSCYDGRSW